MWSILKKISMKNLLSCKLLYNSNLVKNLIIELFSLFWKQSPQQLLEFGLGEQVQVNIRSVLRMSFENRLRVVYSKQEYLDGMSKSNVLTFNYFKDTFKLCLVLNLIITVSFVLNYTIQKINFISCKIKFLRIFKKYRIKLIKYWLWSKNWMISIWKKKSSIKKIKF